MHYAEPTGQSTDANDLGTHYRLTVPHRKERYVVAAQLNMWDNHQWALFPATPEGEVIAWSQLGIGADTLEELLATHGYAERQETQHKPTRRAPGRINL